MRTEQSTCRVSRTVKSPAKNIQVLSVYFSGVEIEPEACFGAEKWRKLLAVFDDEKTVAAIKIFVGDQL